MLRKLAPLFACGAIGMLALPLATPACLPQGVCDETPGGVYCRLGGGVCPGKRTSDTHWESNALAGTWLRFPKNSSLELDPRDPDGTRLKGRITASFAWISACETPTMPGCNYALASGNNAEWFATAWGTLYLKNSTCEDFYVRVVIETDGIDTGDGGASQDGTIDAAGD